jgi:hypothetical protein
MEVMTMAVANQINRGYVGVYGIFDTRRKYDLSDKIIWEDRMIAKFLNVMSRNLTKIAVSDPEPRLLNYVPEASVFPLASDAASGATSLSIADTYANQLQAGDELAIVPKTLDATSTVYIYTVTGLGTSSGGVTPVNISPATSVAHTAANVDIVWLANAVEEGGGGGVPIFKEPGYIETYLQTFHKVIGETRTRMNSDYYGKLSLQQRAKIKRAQLMEQVEFALFLNKKNKEIVNGAEKRKTPGLLETIPPANKVDMTGKMEIKAFSAVAEQNIFAQGNKRREKFLYVGGGFKNNLDAMFYNNPQLYFTNKDLSNFYGFDISTLNLGSGKLHVVVEDIWRGTGLYNSAFWVDMDYVTYLYLKNSDFQIAKNTEDNNKKWNRTEWVLWGEIGLYVAFQNAHGFMYNPSTP